MTLWTVAHKAPLSMEFSRQEYWRGLPFPTPGYLPNPGIESRSPVLQADSQYLPNLFLTYSYTFTFDFFCLIVDLLHPRQFTSEKCSVCLASIATSSQAEESLPLDKLTFQKEEKAMQTRVGETCSRWCQGDMTEREQQGQRRKSPVPQGAGRKEPPVASQQPGCFPWCSPGRPPRRDWGLAGQPGTDTAEDVQRLSGWGRGHSDKDKEVLAYVILNTSAGGKSF